ncbi:MAG: hypothetical protein HY266_03700 [Deltaproteobacteria bacterium]|nr:hypothetical protein [Deltaproteobacteria bacterium]
MKTEIVINEKIKNIIRELEFKGVEDLIKDTVMTEIVCKVSNFSEEVEHFEKKYGKGFDDFNREYEAGEENFSQYDDLMAWKFAQEGKVYWEDKLKELKNVL